MQHSVRTAEQEVDISILEHADFQVSRHHAGKQCRIHIDVVLYSGLGLRLDTSGLKLGCFFARTVNENTLIFYRCFWPILKSLILNRKF